MAISEHLEKKLKQKLAASSLVEMKYKGNDLSVKTDAEGNAVMVFIGRRKPGGNIKGERYARRLLKSPSGETIKDHWELKGPAS